VAVMSVNEDFYIDPKDIALLKYEVFYLKYIDRYIMILDIFNDGINSSRQFIFDEISKSNLKNDIGGIAEDEFSILDELDNENSHIFKIYTIVSMYSESEITLKKWLEYLRGCQNIGNIEDIEKKYNENTIELSKLDCYEDFNCLRLLNNSIKHNDSIANKKIECPCLSEVFNKNDNIQLSEGQIITLADNISKFMLNVLEKVKGKLSQT
jgi:hypothetical protein